MRIKKVLVQLRHKKSIDFVGKTQMESSKGKICNKQKLFCAKWRKQQLQNLHISSIFS
jgi:hypothetical protein